MLLLGLQQCSGYQIFQVSSQSFPCNLRLSIPWWFNHQAINTIQDNISKLRLDLFRSYDNEKRENRPILTFVSFNNFKFHSLSLLPNYYDFTIFFVTLRSDFIAHLTHTNLKFTTTYCPLEYDTLKYVEQIKSKRKKKLIHLCFIMW